MLTLKQEGVLEAREAYLRLKEATIASRDDSCEFHLYYGLFLLGIGDMAEASKQFALAHKYSVTNVFVLIQMADVDFELAMQAASEGAWLGTESVAMGLARQCAVSVRKILELSPNNGRARSWQEELFHRFKIEV